MKNKIVIAIVLMISIFIKLSAQQVNGVVISDTSNIKVVKVWGTHYERGFAYGYLCSGEIYTVFHNYILPNYGTLLPIAKALIGTPGNFTIDSIYITEGKAMVDGLAAAGVDTTDISYLDLFAVNFMTDLQGFYSFKEGGVQNCSSLMNWGEATMGTDLNGKSVIAHHLDATSLASAITTNQVVIIHIPSETDEQPWMLTGTAGQMSASQALNIKGLTAFLNTVEGFSAEGGKGYEPVTLAMRKGLEQKDYNNDGFDNVNDIRDALSSNTNGYASGFIICTLAPSTAVEDSLIAMVAELTPELPYTTFRYNNYPDSIDGDNLYAANDMVKRNDAQIYCSRYLNVSQEINNTYNGINIGSDDNWDIMKSKSIQSTNLQFIQVIPEECVFKMAVSHNAHPAYQSAPQEFNFCNLFFPNNVPQLTADLKNISLFPNPASDIIFIDTKNYTDTYKVEIYNMLNQMILSNEIEKKSGIDISGFPKGIYLAKIYSEENSQVIKFVKQ